MLEGGSSGDDGGGFYFSELYDIWIFSIVGAICVGLSGIFPLLVIPIESGPTLKYGEPAKKLRLMLSFAVGSLLGDVFLHLLPEVWAHVDRSRHDSFTGPSLWIISGLLGFMCIENLLGASDNEEEEEKEGGNTVCRETYKFTKSCDQTVHNNNKPSDIPKSLPSSSSPSSSFSSQKSSLSISSSLPSPSPSLSSKISSPKSSKKSKNGASSNVKSIKNGITPSKKSTSKSNQQSKQTNGKHVPSDRPNSSSSNIHSSASSQPQIKISGYLNLFANIVDNFTHGLAVGSSFCISTKVGVLTTFAILLHEIPHEVGDFAILLQSGFDKWKAAKAQLYTASGGVIGAITALAFDKVDVSGGLSAWILPFTSGGFLYIALVTVVPELVQEKNPWESLKQVVCICIGVLSIITVTFAFE